MRRTSDEVHYKCYNLRQVPNCFSRLPRHKKETIFTNARCQYKQSQLKHRKIISPPNTLIFGYHSLPQASILANEQKDKRILPVDHSTGD